MAWYLGPEQLYIYSVPCTEILDRFVVQNMGVACRTHEGDEK